GDAAPERKRFVKMSDRLASVAGSSGITSPSSGRFGTQCINLGPGQSPTRTLPQHEALAQGTTQGRNVGLQRLGGGARRLLAPEQFKECVGRYAGTAVEPEHGEECTRFGTRNRDR